MFCLFYKGIFKGFWSNKLGDVFLKGTMQALCLDNTKVELHYYPDLPDAPEFYSFTSGYNLEIKEQVITKVPVTNPETKEVVEVEEISENVIRVIEPTPYYANGIFLIPC